MFNYGSFKLLLAKICLGIFLLSFALFLFVSIYTHNPNDPGIGKLVGKSEITNFFGFWGALFSSIFLTLYGKSSFLLVIFIFYLSVFVLLGLVIKRPFLKILLFFFSEHFIIVLLVRTNSNSIIFCEKLPYLKLSFP